MVYNSPNVESLLAIIFSLIDCRIISTNYINYIDEHDNKLVISFLIVIDDNGLKYRDLLIDLCKQLDMSIKLSPDFKNNYMNELIIKFDYKLLNNHVFILNEFKTLLKLQGIYNTKISKEIYNNIYRKE